MTARLLLVDDDSVFREVLARAMRKRGFDVTTAHDARSAIAQATLAQPSHAVVDLKLPGDSGLTVVQRLRELAPSARIVVLTGFASIATAVEAIKLGATHYLAKPASADDVIRALGAASGKTETAINDSPLSVERLQWETYPESAAGEQGQYQRHREESANASAHLAAQARQAPGESVICANLRRA
jgi:two-component system, response regulator RegA